MDKWFRKNRNGRITQAYRRRAKWIWHEGLYRMAQSCVRSARTLDEAAWMMLYDLDTGENSLKTPDWAPYTYSSIRAALVGMKK